jgi:protein gp37
MSDRSPIEWTEATWNPVRGCSKVSPGCKHCYAEAFAERFRGVPGHPFEDGFDLRLAPHKIDEPLGWSRPRKIFVNSMSDLFHESIPEDYIRRVFAVMVLAHWHTYQVLTKRSERLLSMAQSLPWPSHVWMGVSIESDSYVGRADDLRQVPAAVRFVSAEPLLGPLSHLNLAGIDWVIAGGESGHYARPMDLAWAREIRNRCAEAGVAFFLKQLGGRRDKRGGEKAVLDGIRWIDFPESPRHVRKFVELSENANRLRRNRAVVRD